MHRPQRFACLASSFLAAALLTACGGNDDSGSANPAFATLDGKAPLVIAHRGASGYYPEETLEAHTLAIAMGADVIEPDIVVTKDGALIARHDITLTASTDVAAHPEFTSRKRAGENGDGEAVAADWFVADFTLAEIKTLGATSPNHALAKRYDGLFKVVTFQEIIDLVKQKAQQTGRTVAIYPETKNPSYHLALFRAGKIPARMEDTLVALINANGPNSRDSALYVQSFEPTSLQYMRAIGSKVKQVQLIDAYDVDFAAGKMVYGTAPGNLVYSQPTDWKLAGRTELFDSMLTPAGLAQVTTYADGIGAWKPMIVPLPSGRGTRTIRWSQCASKRSASWPSGVPANTSSRAPISAPKTRKRRRCAMRTSAALSAHTVSSAATCSPGVRSTTPSIGAQTSRA